MEEETLDIIKNIHFLYNIITNLDIEEIPQRIHCIQYIKNDVIYFEYEKNCHNLYYNFEYIYKVLYFKYNLNRGNQAHDLVKNMMNEHLHLKIHDISTYRP
jgi:hypothetical protein